MKKLTTTYDIHGWALGRIDLPVFEVMNALADASGEDLQALGFLHLTCSKDQLDISTKRDVVQITSTLAFKEAFGVKLALQVSRASFEQFSTFPAC